MESSCRVSFVVTSRNDDHGGRMLSRFGIFADGLLEQANRHGLSGELIVVEWNPPPGPRLHEVLKLRQRSDSFAVRFIEVPPAAHEAIRNSDTIPLFQMIAKNVGIRRARGEFVVATNPDVLFSDALIAFLARGKLQADTMHRLDRHDVIAEIPEDAGIAEQLAWCARHVLRIHGRMGTFAPKVGGPLQRLWRLGQTVLLSLGGLILESVRTVLSASRGLRPWQVTRILSGLTHVLRRSIYRLSPARLKRAITRTHVLFGSRRVLRNALWLGLRKLLGPPRVHTNGCGDFTLLSRDHWLELRGYPELPLWSMHLDSFLCYMGVASGLREQILAPPCVMFHMEHERSWVVMTPEERLRTFALKPWIDIGLLGDLWEDAYKTRRPLVFNDGEWGLAGWRLEEVRVLSGERQVIEPTPMLLPVEEGR